MKTMVNIRKSTTYVMEAKDFESPKGSSMTIPDMTMPLKVLLDRHSRGLEVPQYTPSYSDEEIPDLARLDLSEIAELKEINQERIVRMRSSMQQAQSMERNKENKPAPLPNGTDFDEANTPPKPTE